MDEEESSCLAQSFQAAAARFPGEVCVIHALSDGSMHRCYTFSELWSCIEALSRVIVQCGVLDPVAVLIPRSAEYLVAILAINRAAGIFVPLDTSWPVARIVAVIEDSRAAVIVGCDQSSWLPADYDDHFREVCDRSSCRVLRIHGLENERKLEMEGNTTATIKRPPFSYIMYTSGSTGQPKGVCGTDVGLLNRLRWMEQAYPHLLSDVALFKTATGFVDHLTEAFGPVLAGAVLLVPCEWDIKQNPLHLFKYLQIFSVTRLVAVPSLLLALLPLFQASNPGSICLRTLVSSGESLSCDLMLKLRECLPRTRFLNLYGSTEVSGDCSCYDCDELNALHSGTNLPIGKAITGCSIYIQPVHEADGNYGELYVSGTGVAYGYWNDHYQTAQRFIDSVEGRAFKTGDLVKRLKNGDIVLVGRTDRLLQMHGQRIEPEEIERTLEGHPCVKKAAVVPLRVSSDGTQLGGCVILKHFDNTSHVKETLREWLRERLPSYMVPERYIFVDTFPLTSSGKVDHYAVQKLWTVLPSPEKSESLQEVTSGPLQRIIEVFSNVLLTANLSPSDDFFLSGGTSVSAAHAAHALGIDMRLLFKFRTALELQEAMQNAEGVSDIRNRELRRDSSREEVTCSCFLRTEREVVHILDVEHRQPWLRHISDSRLSVFVRNDQSACARNFNQVTVRADSSPWEIQVLWNKCLHACVDASPLLLITPSGYRLYIGSHSWKFFCIDAMSGEEKWETTLGGRVESTAVATSNFSQIVVGCYDGFLHCLDPGDGRILWSFETGGEVKCQPVVDAWDGFIWCGSHDHHIYVLDPVSRLCVWKNLCHGSIFASPAIDSLHREVYIATTSGRLYLIHTQPDYSVTWERDLQAPVFASPTFDPSTGYVLVATVAGSITAFTRTGDISWKVCTCGPIFSAASISSAIFHQVLVCSRDGYVYSYCQLSGKLLWKICLDDPIVAGPWLDGNIEVIHEDKLYRLLCVCTTSGRLYVLRTPVDVSCDHFEDESKSQVSTCTVEAAIKLPGDAFSTPLMLGGHIFVGCRDNNMYKLMLRF